MSLGLLYLELIAYSVFVYSMSNYIYYTIKERQLLIFLQFIMSIGLSGGFVLLGAFLVFSGATSLMAIHFGIVFFMVMFIVKKRK